MNDPEISRDLRVLARRTWLAKGNGFVVARLTAWGIAYPTSNGYEYPAHLEATQHR